MRMNMFGQGYRNVFRMGVCAVLAVLFSAAAARAGLFFGQEELVQADANNIDVPGYSVPSYVDWDNDGLKDLIVGEGSGTVTPKVRVYLNSGTAGSPSFTTYSYAQSNGSDLTVPGSGCLGLFPRVVYWDADARKDLLVGQGNGYIKLFLNNATDEAPSFDSGTFLQVGPPGSKANIYVGSRATPIAVDWNNDGNKDLLAGAYDGRMHLFINEGTDGDPNFLAETVVQEGAADLIVSGNRSSPAVGDLNDDGRKDLVSGNTDGELIFYGNTGTDAAPSFSNHWPLQSYGIPILIPGYPRTRPFLCDWTGDGKLDLLVGAGDGLVRLYQGIGEPPYHWGDANGDGRVNVGDLGILGYNYGACGMGWPEADFNADGCVNVGDLGILGANYGWSEGGGSVPEPAAAALLAAGALGLLKRRRSR